MEIWNGKKVNNYNKINISIRRNLVEICKSRFNITPQNNIYLALVFGYELRVL
jgi:hypothetical protein